MPTIIIQADWPEQLSDNVTLIERVVPRRTRDDSYVQQLLERLTWAFEDAERVENDLLATRDADARADSSASSARVHALPLSASI